MRSASSISPPARPDVLPGRGRTELISENYLRSVRADLVVRLRARWPEIEFLRVRDGVPDPVGLDNAEYLRESRAHAGPLRFVSDARHRLKARALSRCLLASAACFLAAVCLGQQTALGDGFASSQAAGLLNEGESPLAVPGVQLLDEGQQTRAGAEARRASPTAFIA